MEKIIHGKTLIAIRIKKLKNGIIPLTEQLAPLQVMTHKRGAGSITKAHFHNPKKRVTLTIHECLVVTKGKIKVDLYTNKKKHFKSLYMTAGQSIIFMDGGHSVRIMDETEIIEIKNGPFVEDRGFIEP